MNNFPQSHPRNRGGNETIWFAPISDVENIPDPVEGIIEDNISLASGKTFFQGYASNGTLVAEDDPVEVNNGLSFPNSVKGRVPKDNPQTLILFIQMMRKRFLVLKSDMNGMVKSYGSIGNGMRFRFKTLNPADAAGYNGYEWEFYRTSDEPAWFYSGEFTVDSTVYSYSYVPPTAFSGINYLNGLSAGRQYFTTGQDGTDFNIQSTGDTHVFNIPNAQASIRGLMSTGAQTFSGAKSFSSALSVNLFVGAFTNNATLHVRSALTVSGNALILENGSPSNILTVSNTALFTIGTQNVLFFPTANGTGQSLNGKGLGFTTTVTSQDAPSFSFNFSNSNAAAGTQYGMHLNGTFNPTLGSKNFVGQCISIICNQTGGANGNITGIKIEPTFTQAVGDFRAFWSTAGKIVFDGNGVHSYMVPHRLTTTQRDDLTNLVASAFIFNTTLGKYQMYNGAAWETVTSV